MSGVYTLLGVWIKAWSNGFVDHTRSKVASSRVDLTENLF